jgi:predicted O-methyltransferase YrrM
MGNATNSSYSESDLWVNPIRIMMNTLKTPALEAFLDELFAAADETRRELERRTDAMPQADRDRWMASVRNDYLGFYTEAKDVHLAVSRETASLLYMLARSSGACQIVEFGTSFGISTVHLAAALRDNGGGVLVTTEFEAGKVQRAQKNLEQAGLADLVEIREGDALETLTTGLPEVIDLVLLDGAKTLYPRILELLEPKLRPGALVIADNADWSPEYLERVRKGGGYLSVPFAEDVELSMRLG